MCAGLATPALLFPWDGVRGATGWGGPWGEGVLCPLPTPASDPPVVCSLQPAIATLWEPLAKPATRPRASAPARMV